MTYAFDFFLFGLVLLFIGLKLTGHISWSWWAVFAPLWAPIAATFALVLLVALIYGVAKAFSGG